MLQQTQVYRVIDKYKEFVSVFPNVRSLSQASLRKILNVWQGLGYNRRALSLKRLATMLIDEYDGRVPSCVEELMRLPGVGRATASAACAFAYNKPVVFIETNIRSVFIHHFFKGRVNIHDKAILPFIEQTLDKNHPRTWYSALMDYGTELKKALPNPSQRSHHHCKQSPFQGSDRQVRGMIIKRILSEGKVSETAFLAHLSQKKRYKRILRRLEEEGLVKMNGRYLEV